MQSSARNEIKICSKINDNDLLNHNFSVRSILDNILKELNTEYVDILMFHSPALLLHEHATKILEELIVLKREGKIKEIGVSNFTVSDLERMGEYRRLIKYNQIEMSPYFTQDETVGI